MKNLFTFTKENPHEIAAIILCIIVLLGIAFPSFWISAPLLAWIALIFLIRAKRKMDKLEKIKKDFSGIIEAYGSLGEELKETFLAFAQKIETASKKENNAQSALRTASNSYLFKNQELAILNRKVTEAAAAKEIAEKAKDDAEKVYIASAQELNALKDKIS